jgi:hypothetical protein
VKKVFDYTFILLVFLAGGISGALLNREKPVAPVKVTEHPATKTDIKITKQGKISASGEVSLPVHKEPFKPVTASQDPAQTEITGGGATTNTPPKPEAPSRAFYGLIEGDVVKVPIKGTESSIYKDNATGNIIGSGEHEVSGTATITVKRDTVAVDLALDNSQEIGIDLEKKEEPRQEFGLYYCLNNTYQSEYSYNLFQVNRVAITLKGYGTYDPETAKLSGHIMAGIRVKL